MAFGNAVRATRHERGLSQEEASLQAGVSRGFFGKVGRGESSATFETIVKVARGLEAPAAEVVALAERELDRSGRGG